jgi:predicted N-acyltransferase
MSKFLNSIFGNNPLAFLSELGNISLFHSITEIDKDSWNSLTGENNSPKGAPVIIDSGESSGVNYNNPFLEYEFLKGLEISKSIGKSSGWLPYYLAVFSSEKKLIGAIPLYLKYNSYGEFIFDWSWASAYNQSGLPYYPKLVIAIPFTPATGNRILIHPEANYIETATSLVNVVLQIAKALKVSSVHWLFTKKEEMELLVSNGFMPRYTYQFHWKNRDYKNFDDFLQEFNSKKRNQLKRERRQANEGIEIETLTGEQIQPIHWKTIYTLYVGITYKKWAHDYLTEDFFTYISQNFKENVVLVMAKKEGKYIAGALNFRKGEHLYGRYWGCLEEHQCLHFEVCYYQSIEYAIKEGIKLFEAGAQGEHKLSRGFLPEYTYSAHWIADTRFSQAIDDFLKREKNSMHDLMENYEQNSPFKKPV